MLQYALKHYAYLDTARLLFVMDEQQVAIVSTYRVSLTSGSAWLLVMSQFDATCYWQVAWMWDEREQMKSRL